MELDKPLSGWAAVDHMDVAPLPGESGIVKFDKGLKGPFRAGIIMPLPLTVGDESGEDSASVEWWRFVQALEKSIPRDRRGSADAGYVYEVGDSNLGD